MVAHAFLAALLLGSTALAAEEPGWHGRLASVLPQHGQNARATPEPMLPLTMPPLIYRFGYTDQYFTEPGYIEQFRAAPPDLLHVGKAVPITHQWGPVGLLAGENQYTGSPQNLLVPANVALLPPEAMEGRIACIRETLARYHAAGVREIVPYIALHTLAGDHQKRLGFWKFYDQWAKYERWAGPRPAHDPSDWLAVDRAGKPLPGACGGTTPGYFAPLHRYLTCINHPEWVQWQRRLIEMIAEVGYDGCCIDNVFAVPCYCPHCKESFRKWLAANRNLDWVRRQTKGLAVEQIALDSKRVPAELVRRWRVLNVTEHLGMLRRTARRIKPGFTLFPNLGYLQDFLVIGSQCDRLMLESGSPPGLRSSSPLPQMGEGPGGRAAATGQGLDTLCVDHLPTLLFTQHGFARTTFLLDYLNLEKDTQNIPAAVYYLNFRLEKRWDNLQELALAEMAAFSGGGGVTSEGRPQAIYRTFFKKHADLFAGWRPTAPAAVLYAYWGPNPLSPYHGNHPPTTHERLITSHRPYVALIDARLPERAKELADFRVLYLESPAYEMSPPQLGALGDYARHGRLVLGDRRTTINGRPIIELLGTERVAIWDAKRPALPTAAVAPTAGLQQNLRFAIYQKGDRLAVHAVNYNVCLMDRQKKLLEVEATPLSIPLPAGWKSAQATCFDPSAAPVVLPCHVADGAIRLRLPKVHIYKIVLLERR